MPVVLNPDSEVVQYITRKLSENNGYCPCRLVKNDDTKCMCAEFREQISNQIEGACHCGKFIFVKQ